MSETETIPQDGLGEQDLAVLRIGCATYRQDGQLANAIRDLGLSEPVFYRRLHQLLDDPRALPVDPVNVNRLRRLRSGKMNRRFR